MHVCYNITVKNDFVKIEWPANLDLFVDVSTYYIETIK